MTHRFRTSMDTCENCDSNRNGRNVMKYEVRGDKEVLIGCSDCPPKGLKTVDLWGDYGVVTDNTDLTTLLESYIDQAPNHILEFEVDKVSINWTNEGYYLSIKGHSIGVDLSGDEMRNPETLTICDNPFS